MNHSYGILVSRLFAYNRVSLPTYGINSEYVTRFDDQSKHVQHSIPIRMSTMRNEHVTSYGQPRGSSGR